MNGETKYHDVVSGYPTHISQNSNSGIVHDDAARVIISTAMSVLDLHPESMEELESIRVFWLAAGEEMWFRELENETDSEDESDDEETKG